MKPMIVQIAFYGPDGAGDGGSPQLLSAVVFANDESDALERIMPAFQKEYDMPEASFREGESDTVIAFGVAEDGRSFSAQSFDAVLKPHLFIQLSKDMQYESDVCFEDDYRWWAMEHPIEASRLMEVLDKKVGDVFVNDVIALQALRPLITAWRERATLADSVQVGGEHRKSKSL